MQKLAHPIARITIYSARFLRERIVKQETITKLYYKATVVPTKSDSGEILCLKLLSNLLTCTLHLSIRESIDHLCINPILWIGLIHK